MYTSLNYRIKGDLCVCVCVVHNHIFFFLSLWASVFVVGDDSHVSNVTGGWMDKAKDQINSFSHCLIAHWEPKVFYYQPWSNF